MMDWTDRHDRYFLRLITQHARLYTEMVNTGAVLQGDQQRYLQFDPAEQPLAIQLGGSNPQALATSAAIAEQWGYSEVNLNVGCPSARVQSGRFGACLMAEPELVRDCVAAMVEAVDIPVTVKCRIGIDQQDDYTYLEHFVNTVKTGGCSVFIVHARVAILGGLSPKENREVPPLKYEHVYRLKREQPELTVVLNGGVNSLEQAEAHLKQVDGVMIGREAYHNPFILAAVDQRLFADSTNGLSRQAVVDAFIPYIESQLAAGQRLSHMTRHILGLFHAQPGGKRWRRYLSEHANQPGADADVVRAAAARVGE